jgi:ubiquinone/menaquinone biosynthesis C-methylase UbiE
MHIQHYLDYTFIDTPESVDTFDELPLWSAPFGRLLLKHIPLKHNLTVLDIGSGAGFPLIEIAERLGPTSKCYGLDPWVNANNRARKKIRDYALTNVEVIDGSAEQIPFGNVSIGLIVSNLGINNFDNPDKVLAECHRVLKPNGSIALTSNLNGHWKEFYSIFEQTLSELGKKELIPALHSHCEHRGTMDSITQLLESHHFKISSTKNETLEMRFLDGSSFLNHHFIKLGWMASWKGLIPAEEQQGLFELLEKYLNTYSHNNNGFALSVPMAYIEASKPI